MADGWRVGIDIGGTFTDVVAFEPATGRTLLAKVRSTADDLLRGLLAGLEAVGLRWEEVAELVHGTTIVTNAIVKGELARVAFVTTEGFSDVLAIGRQNRLHLYRLDLEPKLPAQVPEELRFEVMERVTHAGDVLVPLGDGLERLAQDIGASGAEAVAVSLLHSYAHPAHEEAVGRRLSETVPHVALSHRVNPEAREFERASTTALSAGVMPLVARYLDRLEGRCPPGSRLRFFHSASGMCSPSVLRELPLSLALSGPAAGVSAAEQVARELGIDHALTFDMGGTTTDVCLIVEGRAKISANRVLAGRPLRMPAVAVESIGAGGGSIVRLDGGRLTIGPDSAGADPGPACYGRGGRLPTISDANMLLGFLEDGATFGGDIRLSRREAEAAFRPLALGLGVDLGIAAAGVVDVANNMMSGALRQVTVERGIDPRSCTLIAYGGAGPMHAVEVARLLGIRRVVAPAHSGAFSAVGCLTADLSYTQQQTVTMSRSGWDAAKLMTVQEGILRHLHRVVDHEDARDTEAATVASLRYLGQSYAIEVPDPDLGDPDALERAFLARHEQVYGFASRHAWELVALRVTLSVPRDRPNTSAGTNLDTAAPSAWRSCVFRAAPTRTPDYRRAALSSEQRVEGPAVVTDPSSTLIVPPGSSVAIDRAGHLHIDLDSAR